jgi:hypothetical protein
MVLNSMLLRMVGYRMLLRALTTYGRSVRSLMVTVSCSASSLMALYADILSHGI